MQFDDLVMWLDRNKLRHRGHVSLRELRRWRSFNYGKWRYSDTLNDILEMPQTSRKRKSMQKDARFLSAVGKYFAFWGGRNAHERIRRGQWPGINIPTRYARAVESLRALREALIGFNATLAPYSYSRCQIIIPENSLGFGVQFEDCMDSKQIARRITAVFQSIGDNRYGINCNCGPLTNEPCQHVRVLVEWLLDVLSDPVEPAHQVLMAQFRKPFWQIGVQQLKREIQAAAKPSPPMHLIDDSERLVWRINPEYRGRSKLIVEPILQAQNYNGRWSRGRRITESEWRSSSLQAVIQNHSPVREYLRILHEKKFLDSESLSKRLCEFIRRLVDQPNVLLLEAGTAIPVRVECHNAVFAVSPSENGVQTVVRIGNWHIKPHGIASYMISSRHLYVVDSKERRFLLGQISEDTLPFVRFCGRTSRELPSEAMTDLISLISQVDGANVWVHPSLRGETVAPDMRIVVRIIPEGETEFIISLHVCPTGSGATYHPGEGPRALNHVVKGNGVFVERDLKGEVDRAAAVADALNLSMESTSKFCWHIENPDRALEVLAEVNQLSDVIIEWPEGASALRVLRAGTQSLKVTARQKQEWFSIGGGVTVEDVDVPFEELLRQVRQKRRYIRLRKGEYLILQKELYDRLAAFAASGGGDIGAEIEVPLARIPLFDKMLDDLSFDGGDDWNAVRSKIAESADISLAVPAGFKGKLRSYQNDGFAWLARLSHWARGACLADDMGLGKTLQALTLILWQKRQSPAIVVSPMSVCHNWLREASVFTPTLDVRLFHGDSRDAALQEMTSNTVIVTSYDTLTANMQRLKDQPFDLMVLDEAQMIKNALSRRAKAVCQMNATFKLALTGTLVENHLGDLWSIFHAIIPGLLGSFERFRKQYAIPIERDSDQQARETLRQLISPFLLRRNKADVIPELPSRIETISEVELGDRHMAIYNTERLRILDALESNHLSPVAKRFSVLSGLTKLRRLACHPRLVDNASMAGSVKMDRILETIQELVSLNQRALVFSQFTGHLALLHEALEQIGIDYLYLDGGTPLQRRTQVVTKWQEGNTPLFLISLKAGGFGLNLTGADYVLHLDPWWNPAAEDQATDRTHRIGQTKPVTVVRFVSCDTVEQAVVALHDRKRGLAESILKDSGSNTQLSPEELIALIRGE